MPKQPRGITFEAVYATEWTPEKRARAIKARMIILNMRPVKSEPEQSQKLPVRKEAG